MAMMPLKGALAQPASWTGEKSFKKRKHKLDAASTNKYIADLRLRATNKFARWRFLFGARPSPINGMLRLKSEQ